MSEETIIQKQETRKLRVSIKTIGCQMNEYETSAAQVALEREGFVLADTEEAADAVILNTCSVREHAENRAFNKLHVLCRAKRNGRAGLKIGLMGCMSDNYREKLLKDFPELDFIAGTRNVLDVPRLLREAVSGGRQVAAVSKEGWWEEYADIAPRRESEGVRAFLPIMTGCDNLCTYCIVPKTRGREVSMRGGKVIEQVRKLADRGYKEIQLLGQNVNSYGRRYVGEDESYRTRREPNRFPELVAAAAEVAGIERVSWMTSHPKDASVELFQVMRDYPKVTHWFHLPLQSGNSRMLKRMGREYSIDEFRDRLARLREFVPDASVTTDIIVGFSGETEEEFEDTCRAMEELKFDGGFIFKYSLRKGTPGERLADDVPVEVKERRNQTLLDLQRRISKEKNSRLIGTTTDILISGPSRYRAEELIGHTRAQKRVIVHGPASRIGSIRRVKLTELKNETFRGEIVSP